jgi:hypothetical protein
VHGGVSVFFIVEDCVSVSEHGLFDKLPLKLFHRVIGLIPLGRMSLASAIVIHSPASLARSVLQEWAHLFRDIN